MTSGAAARSDGEGRQRAKKTSLPGSVLALAAGVAFGPALPSCNRGDDLLRAKVIETRAELVGGPAAVADVGDFLLENDQIRVAILGPRDSPGPGVFGGSVVDIDLRRSRIGHDGGLGRDRFAEAFPVANLLVPDPKASEVRVLRDGTDGLEAAIRVEGHGEFLFEALGILRNRKELLESFFPNVHVALRFRTDYVLRPGDRHILVRTTVILDDEQLPGCPDVKACTETCEVGRAFDPAAGCVSCACSEVLPLPSFTEPASVFGGILGDPAEDPTDDAASRAGMVAGDFVFFGNQNDVFAPGAGFDEDTAVQDAFNSGRNTFQEPLVFDFVAAAGDEVSYGYFTAHEDDGPQPVVNVPLFTSAATAFLAAGRSCLHGEEDDAACDARRAFSYERFIAVGEGDVASVLEEMYRVRGTKTGTLRGHVLWQATNEGVRNGRIFVFADPDPKRAWASVDELVEANRDERGDVGLLAAIDADPGLDLQEDGDFHAALPQGDYVVVARDPEGIVASAPLRAPVREGRETVLVPVLPTPALVEYRVTDGTGSYVPAKLAFTSLDAEGRPMEGDGRSRPYLGDSRLGTRGTRTVVYAPPGEGRVEVEPGRYRLVISRGIEHGIATEKDFELRPGEVRRFDVMLPREVDTTGWVSADMHLHALSSFDSGMSLGKRVTTAAAEGIDLAISTDHDAETDYGPTLAALRLEPHIATAVGSEVTTLEQGHFIGFPQRFDHLDVPTHGSHDWTCEPGGAILDALRGSREGDLEPLTIVAHPRDGFFGYIEQLGVDAFTLNRKISLLEENNPVFRTAGCDFDAMEVLNGKRLDLVRTPTVAEVVDWNRCLARVNAAETKDALGAACPEAGPDPLAACSAAEPLRRCRARARTALAWVTMKRILARTPEEQAAAWAFEGNVEDSQALCDPAALGDAPVPEGDRDRPCVYRAGHVDDFFRYLEHGFLPTQVGNSDSHESSKEPGYPRTYYLSPTDDPSAIRAEDAVQSVRAGHAVATYGPFVRGAIDGKTFGETAQASPGQKVSLDLEVQSASWFGVDRVEVYVNGLVERVVEPAEPPSAIVDVKGKVSFEVPPRDSWVVVIAMGLRDDSTLRHVVLDVPFGEIQLSRIASDAFARVPIVSEFFSAPPTVPDWSPVPAYAVTNAIYVDTNGNGKYDAPRPYPDFCSKPCDPGGPADQCPEGQLCLDKEKQCGLLLVGKCDHRRSAFGAGPPPGATGR